MHKRALVPALLAATLGAQVLFAQQQGLQQPPAAQPATQPGEPSPLVRELLDPPATRPGDEIVASYEYAALSRSQLMEFLVQTRGLDALLNLMQLQIARALAQNEGIQVSLADVEAEAQQTLRQAFGHMTELGPEQYPQLLEQLLSQQQLSRAEFDVVMATNAYLKAIARPRIDQMLTEENLRKAFNLRYGEQVRVRHIQLDSLAQVAEVKKRLDAGEDFAKVAAEVSRNADTRRAGGLFPPFSIQSDVPEAFKQAAFGLEAGQLSDPVEAGGFYHLIKLEQRIAPRAVQFDDVRDELKKTVAEEQLHVVTAQLRRLIAQMLASENLQVHDPLLAEQLRQRLSAIQPQPMSPEALKQQMERERPTTPPGPATLPSTRAGEQR